MLFWCSDESSTAFSMIHLELNVLHSNMYNSMVKYVKQYSKKKINKSEQCVWGIILHLYSFGSRVRRFLLSVN